MNNIVCLKWGTKYPSIYVNNLYSMVKRNLTIPYRFVCFTENTDGINPEIECKPLLPTTQNTVGWWHKISFFSENISDLNGTLLFLDLDMVITDNIDSLFTYCPNDFCIMKDPGVYNNTWNSSVFRLEIGQKSFVYDDYVENAKTIMKSMSGDQNYITSKIDRPSIWPMSWILSYKYHICNNGRCEPNFVPDTKIVNFHGHPNPDEAIIGYRQYRPCPWIKDYWR